MDILEKLNPQQREAVMYTEGPLLILAGAGSGKTRVLTCRIAYLLEQCGVKPWNILAITFTNKAAGEMRERVDNLVGMGSEAIWVSTFHSTCCRILRRYIDRIGYDNRFAIYDTDDSRQVMKAVIRELELNPKIYKEKVLLGKISAAKNNGISPDQVETEASRWEEKQVVRAWRAYQDRLKKNNALDFDDLLVQTVRLFQEAPDVLENYQERFRYIMIDEYQDTNSVQFQFVRLLAQKYRNLCVVGDDDQSIYKFRGADIQNILNFENTFPGAKVIKLEQNYRSTQSILDAANEVISHNNGRKEKKLWTDNGTGTKVRFREFPTGYDEAEFVADEIARKVRTGGRSYRDYAVLYRTNAQSRLFEEKMIAANIPYRLVGGVNFYARKEIKDLLAYLKTVDSGMDDLAAQRILNVPKRGIGAASMARVQNYALETGSSFYEALLHADKIPGLGRSLKGVHQFTGLISRLRAAGADYLNVQELLEMIIEETGYVTDLEAEGTDEAKARIENINELISKTADYMEQAEQPSLSEFLQQVSLVADVDNLDPDSDSVLLMTLHSAKGLEFNYVYMAGMEENIFPSYMAVSGDDPEELEEERRLCYVGITRARKELTMTAAQMRMVRGEPQFLRASRFVREIPRELISLEGESGEAGSFMRPPEVSMDRVLKFGSGLGGISSGRQRSSFGTSTRGASAHKYSLDQFRVQKADHLDYQEGDRVRHVKFGVGTVQSIRDGGKDFEVTVDFDTCGVKRMFASFAKLKKV